MSHDLNRATERVFTDAAVAAVRRLGGLMTLLLMTAGCGERVVYPTSMEYVAPPRLPACALTLRVAHVVNPRFPAFSPTQLEQFLAALQASAKAHFDCRIDFAPPKAFRIDEYFAGIDRIHYRWRAREFRYDFKSGKGDRTRLEESYREALLSQRTASRNWAVYAARELGLPAVDTDPDLWKKRLAGAHLERLERLRGIRAADGKPAIDETPLNEWLYWDTLGERDPAFDVTVTNQLIASVEYNGADIHTALRGGLLLGTTSYARHGALGAQFWWSAFPFLSGDVQIASLRGGEHYTAEEAAVLAGTLAAHELGHLLFRHGHPFNVHACIMSPTPMLRFREAVRLLDAAACRAADDPAMARGVIDLRRPEGVQ